MDQTIVVQQSALISTVVQAPAATASAISVERAAPPITLMQASPGWPVSGEYLHTANRLSEFAGNPTAQAQARANLELQNIDGGTFA